MFYDYADSGSWTETTYRANEADFQAIKLRQRVAVNMEGRSLRTRMAGQEVAMPVALAPTGLTGMRHADGEILAARAAERFGVPFTLIGRPFLYGLGPLGEAGLTGASRSSPTNWSSRWPSAAIPTAAVWPAVSSCPGPIRSPGPTGSGRCAYDAQLRRPVRGGALCPRAPLATPLVGDAVGKLVPWPSQEGRRCRWCGPDDGAPPGRTGQGDHLPVRPQTDVCGRPSAMMRGDPAGALPASTRSGAWLSMVGLCHRGVSLSDDWAPPMALADRSERPTDN